MTQGKEWQSGFAGNPAHTGNLVLFRRNRTALRLQWAETRYSLQKLLRTYRRMGAARPENETLERTARALMQTVDELMEAYELSEWTCRGCQHVNRRAEPSPYCEVCGIHR